MTEILLTCNYICGRAGQSFAWAWSQGPQNNNVGSCIVLNHRPTPSTCMSLKLPQCEISMHNGLCVCFMRYGETNLEYIQCRSKVGSGRWNWMWEYATTHADSQQSFLSTDFVPCRS